MKIFEIRTLEELQALDLADFVITEDTEIDIKLKLIDQELEYPINIKHVKPGISSKINIKLALFGKSKVKIPAEIFVDEKAYDTSTSFKALVLLMSPHAQANVTPGLLIHEKNILSASHGVVIKNIKDVDLVYLRARGIQREEARQIIVGF